MLFTIAIKVSKHFAMFLNKLMENLALKIFLRTSSVVLRCFCIFYYRFNPITLLDTNRRNGKFIYKIVKTAHFSTPFYLELSQNCCAAPTLRCLFFQTGIFYHSLFGEWLGMTENALSPRFTFSAPWNQVITWLISVRSTSVRVESSANQSL